MISLETVPATPFEPNSSPRISFSTEFLDEKNFISITPKSPVETEREKACAADFKFLSGSMESETMITADELFFEGKLIPFWQTQSAEKLGKISLKGRDDDMEVVAEEVNKEERRVSWFVDDDPSPRPPKCTVLWKELLRLRKQRPSSLSPSSSSSSSSSSSFRDLPPIIEGKEGSGNREKHVKRIKKGLERTRSTGIRIRPMVNVPISTQGKSNALPPLFPLKKGKVLERSGRKQ